jgi:hypothetical protein
MQSRKRKSGNCPTELIELIRMSLQARQAVAQTLVPLDNKPAVTTEDALASKPPLFEQYALANARYQGMLSAVILSKDAAREGKLRWYEKVLIWHASRTIKEHSGMLRAASANLRGFVVGLPSERQIRP